MKYKQHLAAAAILAAVVVAGCQGGKPTGAPPAGDRAGMVQSEQPPKPKKEFIEARGVYLTGWSAGGKQKMTNVVDLLKKTGMNAVVIDVKDSDGAISFPMDLPWVKEIEAKRGQIKEINQYGFAQRTGKNIDWVMQLLKENNIYPIARIAVFADDILPRVRPDMAAKNESGGIWVNRKQEAWFNPYNKETWKYTVAVAAEAAKKGFKEIQWDYVRFPSDGKMGAVRYPGKTELSQADVIGEFLAYARKELEPYGVVISADIFGLTGLDKGGMGIGQTIHRIAENVDYICPMVYPSHFHKGEYGIRNPDADPYKIVLVSLRDCKAAIEGTNCRVRPWLQNFSLPDRGQYGGSRYGAPQLKAQIRAAQANGISEFLMWDPSNRFRELDVALAQLAKEKPEPVVQWPKKEPKTAQPAAGNQPAVTPAAAPAQAPAGR